MFFSSMRKEKKKRLQKEFVFLLNENKANVRRRCVNIADACIGIKALKQLYIHNK